MKAIVELETNSITHELEGNRFEASIVFIHSNYYFVSPYGTEQENIEVEG